MAPPIVTGAMWRKGCRSTEQFCEALISFFQGVGRHSWAIELGDHKRDVSWLSDPNLIIVQAYCSPKINYVEVRSTRTVVERLLRAAIEASECYVA